MTTRPPDIELESSGIAVGDEHIDTLAPGAARRLRELLGPIMSVHVFPGMGRVAQLLARGLILLVDEKTDALESLMVCFDARDGSPYPAFTEVPVFTAAVDFGAARVDGSERESTLLRIPGVSAIGGLVSLRRGELSVGLHTKKRVGRFGKRTGPRRLVLVDAEWGGVKPFGRVG